MKNQGFFASNQAYIIAIANGVGLLLIAVAMMWVQINTPSRAEFKEYQGSVDTKFDRVLANQDRIYNEIKNVNEQNIRDIEIIRRNSEGLRDHEFRLRHIEGGVIPPSDVETQP